MAQQPDELSLELADVLNILDKTDDGMRDRMGVSAGGWASPLADRRGQAGRDPSLASQLRKLRAGGGKLLPPPDTQKIQVVLAGTATLGLAMGRGRADTDVTQTCSYLDDASQTPGPGLWGTLVADGLSHTGFVLGTTPAAPGALSGNSACFVLASLELAVHMVLLRRAGLLGQTDKLGPLQHRPPSSFQKALPAV